MIKIVITGPESTGKSTLSAALAEHYQTGWVQEYAREYLTQLERPYIEKDLLQIAIGQVNTEQEMRLVNIENKLLLADTDLLTIKIWSQYKYGRVHPFITQQLRQNNSDFYLLCFPDLPWQDDPLRENPGKGLFFFKWYEKELIAMNKPYLVIKGTAENRTNKAIEQIDCLI